MKGHLFVTMVPNSPSNSPNRIPPLNKTAISLNDGVAGKYRVEPLLPKSSSEGAH